MSLAQVNKHGSTYYCDDLAPYFFVGRHTSKELAVIKNNWGYQSCRELLPPRQISYMAMVAVALKVAVLVWAVSADYYAWVVAAAIIIALIITLAVWLRNRNRRILEIINLGRYDYLPYRSELMRSLAMQLSSRAGAIKLPTVVEVKQQFQVDFFSNKDTLSGMLDGRYGLSVRTDSEAILDEYVPFALELEEVLGLDSVENQTRTRLEAVYQACQASVVDELMAVYSTVEVSHNMRAEQFIQLNATSHL